MPTSDPVLIQWIRFTLNKIQSPLSLTHLFNKPPSHSEVFGSFNLPGGFLLQGLSTHCPPAPACDTHHQLLPSSASVQIPALGEAFPDHFSGQHHITQFPSQCSLLSEILLCIPLMGFSLTRLEALRGQGLCPPCSLSIKGHSTFLTNIC